jgi:type II secretory pathway pseudopilin PulG
MKRKAFTLLEIAMVICIITVAVAGIFAVQMISSTSDARGLVAQIQKYDQSIAAFRAKYQALPGDVKNTINQNLSSENTDGDNNGIITNQTMGINRADGEIANFWLHLSKSKMLDENYDGAENELARFGKTFPVSKLGENAGIIVFGVEGESKEKNFYQIGFKFANLDRLFTGNHSITAKDAFYFDKKIDDGEPEKGRVTSAGGDILNYSANEICVKNGNYNLNITSPFCQLKIALMVK